MCIRDSDDCVVIETPGAGGFGPPSERRPEDIANDRLTGKFSDEYLKHHYGQMHGATSQDKVEDD